MAGTMLGEAVTFDSSNKLRPTPNTTFSISLNFKWQYKTLKCFIPPIYRGIGYFFLNLVNPFSHKQASHLPACCSRVCTLGVPVHVRVCTSEVPDLRERERVSSAEKTQSPHASIQS